MNINLTLIVQIIHFFVAFYIIKRFLLAPVIALISEDEHKMAIAHRDIAQSVKKFEHAEEVKQQQWQGFYTFVASCMPCHEKPLVSNYDIVNVDTSRLLSAQQERVLIDEIKNSLIIELSDVN